MTQPVPIPLQIFYPNGQVEACLTYIWDGTKPVAWDGTVTVGSVTSSGKIADGVDASIKATVLNFLGSGGSSNPLTVAIVDTTGAQISSFGGGTQYVDGSTHATPTGTIALWLDTSNVVRAVSASKPLPVSLAANQSVNVAQINGVTPLMGAGNTGTGSARVTIASDQADVSVKQATAANLNATVVGTGTFATQATISGQSKTLKTVSGSLTSSTDIIAAVSSKRLKVFAYSLMTFGTSATTLIFKSNNSTELWRAIVQSVASQVMGANLATSMPGFLFATVAGEKLTLVTNTGDTIHYSVAYWDDDAT